MKIYNYLYYEALITDNKLPWVFCEIDSRFDQIGYNEYADLSQEEKIYVATSWRNKALCAMLKISWELEKILVPLLIETEWDFTRRLSIMFEKYWEWYVRNLSAHIDYCLTNWIDWYSISHQTIRSFILLSEGFWVEYNRWVQPNHPLLLLLLAGISPENLAYILGVHWESDELSVSRILRLMRENKMYEKVVNIFCYWLKTGSSWYWETILRRSWMWYHLSDKVIQEIRAGNYRV
jgi:hypothetical protein